MLINLRIDNADRLPDGGPLDFRAQDRSFEIGRENRDWTLPDPDKIVSGRHCEIRYQAGAFWLYDVSRNGTFVNGSSQRVASPYRLGHGDRLRIGRYIISVALAGDQPAVAAETAGAQRSLAPERDAPHVSRRPETLAPEAASRTGVRQAPEPSGFTFDPDPFYPRPDAAQQPQTSQAPSPQPAPGQAGTNDELLRFIAAGAGVPPETLLRRDPREVAMEIGAVLRTMVDELALLLKARAAAKVLAKSGHRTMISSVDNNPLKFVPASEEIFDIMFSRRRAGYLDAKGSVEDAFRDLKTHELATYAAMQTALARLLDDLSPDTIEKKLPASSFTSKKGRAWDTFVATWADREEAHENGMLDVFLTYFSEAYAKASKPK